MPDLVLPQNDPMRDLAAAILLRAVRDVRTQVPQCYALDASLFWRSAWARMLCESIQIEYDAALTALQLNCPEVSYESVV